MSYIIILPYGKPEIWGKAIGDAKIRHQAWECLRDRKYTTRMVTLIWIPSGY